MVGDSIDLGPQIYVGAHDAQIWLGCLPIGYDIYVGGVMGS
jgi:hypothetical protein